MAQTGKTPSGQPDQATLEARYAAASARIRKLQRVEEGQAGALMFAAMAYGDTLNGSSGLRTLSHLAKLLCIAALFIVPNLLVIHVML